MADSESQCVVLMGLAMLFSPSKTPATCSSVLLEDIGQVFLTRSPSTTESDASCARCVWPTVFEHAFEHCLCGFVPGVAHWQRMTERACIS